jgi:hypothetical protein
MEGVKFNGGRKGNLTFKRSFFITSPRKLPEGGSMVALAAATTTTATALTVNLIRYMCLLITGSTCILLVYTFFPSVHYPQSVEYISQMDRESIIQLIDNIYNTMVSQYNIIVPNTQTLEALITNAQAVIASSNINSLRLED